MIEAEDELMDYSMFEFDTTTSTKIKPPVKIKPPSIFDMLNHLTIRKTKWTNLSKLEQKTFNVWMILNWLIHNPTLCIALNQFQQHLLKMDNEKAYTFFLHLLPKANLGLRWTSGTYDKELDIIVNVISEMWEITEKDALSEFYFLLFLGQKNFILELMVMYGSESKEINLIKKYLSGLTK